MTARRPLVNVSGAIQELPVGDTVTGASEGSGTVTRTEIDFGTTPVWSATFTITDAAVTGTSNIAVTPSGRVATDRAGDDWAWDGLILSAAAGTGQFDLTALAVPGPVVGKRTVQYQIF